jgi:hypothetical protein
MESLGMDAVYVTGRDRKKGEVNGKSGNLNNCLKNVIYDGFVDEETGEIRWAEIPISEVTVVFDADMMAKKDFYCKILEIMMDDEIALCLTPQAFHNIDPAADLFNNINILFWEYWLPGEWWAGTSWSSENYTYHVSPPARPPCSGQLQCYLLALPLHPSLPFASVSYNATCCHSLCPRQVQLCPLSLSLSPI